MPSLPLSCIGPRSIPESDKVFFNAPLLRLSPLVSSRMLMRPVFSVRILNHPHQKSGCRPLTPRPLAEPCPVPNASSLGALRVVAPSPDQFARYSELSQSYTPWTGTGIHGPSHHSKVSLIVGNFTWTLNGQRIHAGGFLCRNTPPTVGRSPRIARNHLERDGSKANSRRQESLQVHITASS
jgi:hypothetical protein